MLLQAMFCVAINFSKLNIYFNYFLSCYGNGGLSRFLISKFLIYLHAIFLQRFLQNLTILTRLMSHIKGEMAYCNEICSYNLNWDTQICINKL